MGKVVNSYHDSGITLVGTVTDKIKQDFGDNSWYLYTIEVDEVIKVKGISSRYDDLSEKQHQEIFVFSKCFINLDSEKYVFDFEINDSVFLYLDESYYKNKFFINNPFDDATVDFNLKQIPSPSIQNNAIKNKHWSQQWRGLGIYCNYGLESIQKNDDYFACVKPSTAEKLVERGWTS